MFQNLDPVGIRMTTAINAMNCHVFAALNSEHKKKRLVEAPPLVPSELADQGLLFSSIYSRLFKKFSNNPFSKESYE